MKGVSDVARYIGAFSARKCDENARAFASSDTALSRAVFRHPDAVKSSKAKTPPRITLASKASRGQARHAALSVNEQQCSNMHPRNNRIRERKPRKSKAKRKGCTL
jgi:hypothetical protein